MFDRLEKAYERLPLTAKAVLLGFSAIGMAGMIDDGLSAAGIKTAFKEASAAVPVSISRSTYFILHGMEGARETPSPKFPADDFAYRS